MTNIIKLTKENLNDHAEKIKLVVEKDIIAASSATTTQANALQRALNGAIYHSLITGKNNLPNNLIIALSKKRVVAGRSQSVLSNYMINKLKAYLMHFIPFIELNKGDAKDRFPLANKSGTKEGLQMDQVEINKLVDSLPLFTSWKKPKKASAHKVEKTLVESFQSFFEKNVEKLIGETIENADDLKLFNALIEIVHSLPSVEKDDLELTKEKTKVKKVA